MSDYHREIASEPSRCDACDRYVTECVADPCEDARESAHAATARWCDLCGQPKFDCTAQAVFFRQDGQVVIGAEQAAHRVASVCQDCYDNATVR